MLEDLVIKPATPADVPALATLINSAYRGEQSTLGWTTEAHLLDGQRTDTTALLELLAAPKATILLCTTPDGHLCGSVYLELQEPALYMGMLSVAPTQQARGIGKRLLQAAEAHARQHACSRMRITVISVRAELIAWYERHGYRRTNETEPFPTDTRFGIPRQPLELLVMEKELS
ncbi:GNAT family N-acetyltransferase [Hymenobacter tibetensis]|uniref:GNAT family N-acetyltransferase n=1 Tax=Hymenobacter tibetensis TaxID=497967 RepID=A0ABY4CRU7_9BACT|nr:GNAT family N-acetyltransferase [Hymenobacter tibetensis]UOG72772.1 GNAT family N-acetyltransferase [Hymenobacter tibetensis]